MPAVTTSVTRIVAFNCVLLTNVVARFVPFHRTTEVETKLVPLTVRGNPAAPASTLLGASELTAGIGLVLDGANGIA